jgi:hypothetical protein
VEIIMAMAITMRIKHQLTKQKDHRHQKVRLQSQPPVSQKEHLHQQSHQHHLQPISQKDRRLRQSHQHRPQPVRQKELQRLQSHLHHLHPGHLQQEHPVAEVDPVVAEEEAVEDNLLFSITLN